MAYSIKLVQKYLRSKPPQEAPIYIRVIYNRRFYHALVKKPIKLSDWDDAHERVKRSFSGATSLNNYFQERKMEVEKIMIELDTKYKLIPKNIIIDVRLLLKIMLQIINI
jgi:integrase/recombinase XerD